MGLITFAYVPKFRPLPHNHARAMMRNGSSIAFQGLACRDPDCTECAKKRWWSLWRATVQVWSTRSTCADRGWQNKMDIFIIGGSSSPTWVCIIGYTLWGRERKKKKDIAQLFALLSFLILRRLNNSFTTFHELKIWMCSVGLDKA